MLCGHVAQDLRQLARGKLGRSTSSAAVTRQAQRRRLHHPSSSFGFRLEGIDAQPMQLSSWGERVSTKSAKGRLRQMSSPPGR